MKDKIRITGLIILLSIMAVGCGETRKEKSESIAADIEEALEMEAPQVPDTKEAVKTIADVVLYQTQYSTLSKSLKAAGLIDILQQPGELTLFAPTNDGFGKLPEEKVADLLKPQGKSKLTDILKYHVVEGRYDAYGLREAMSESEGALTLETLQGTTVKIIGMDGELMLIDDLGDTAKIVEPNVRVGNGMVHGIDKVLLPN